MWISQQTWLRQQEAYIKAVAERQATATAFATQKATLEWLMLRMTQLEAERAKLLWKYMGVSVPSVELEVAPEVNDALGGSQLQNPLNRVPNFDDIGDHEARKQGITWNQNGELVYGKPDGSENINNG